jgi:hypothetical protein
MNTSIYSKSNKCICDYSFFIKTRTPCQAKIHACTCANVSTYPDNCSHNAEEKCGTVPNCIHTPIQLPCLCSGPNHYCRCTSLVGPNLSCIRTTGSPFHRSLPGRQVMFFYRELETFMKNGCNIVDFKVIFIVRDYLLDQPAEEETDRYQPPPILLQLE